MGFTRQELAAAAGVDPWKLTDQLASGDPEEIYSLAKAFNSAAADQHDSVKLTTKGLDTTGNAYTVNDQTPIDVETETAHAKSDLGNSGEKLGKVAKILSDVASDLAQRTSKAKSQIKSLDSEVDRIGRDWDTYWQGVGHQEASRGNQDGGPTRDDYLKKAAAKVKATGGPIKKSVSDYEDALGKHLRAMADLGYIPPSAVDEGPGDVDIPDAKKAGDGTVAATKEKDPKKAKADFAKNTEYLDLLNRKKEAGVPLSDAEKQWMKTYYTEVTPHFGEIKDWADKLTHTRDGHMPDRNDPVTHLVSRVADGFLNLSKEVPYKDLPKSAQDILASNLGHRDDKGRLLPDMQVDAAGNPIPPTGDPTLMKDAGFVGLLNDYSTDNAAPSDELAGHMKDAALRWKHQINTMYTNYKADYRLNDDWNHNWGHHELSGKEWNKLFPDELSSDALGVVSHNRQYTNDWIVHNAAERREVMGMNWQDGHGAADVLLSASVPGHGLSGHDAAAAGLAIVEDASSDYRDYAHMANSTVKAAVGDVGLAYIDSFAKDPTGTHPSVGMITLPDGTKVPGFSLDEGTKDNFMKFIAASDPKEFQHFREGALERGQWYLQQAMEHGHTNPNDPAYQAALRDGVRLTSGVDAGAAGYLVDEVHASGNNDHTRKIAEDLSYAKAVAAYNVRNDEVSGVKAMFSIAGLIPNPASKAVSIGSTGFGLVTDQMLTPPPAPDQNPYIKDLQIDVVNLSDGHVADDRAKAEAQQNLLTMVVGASKASGHPIIDPTTHHAVALQPNGQYPESVRASVYNSVDNYTADLGQQVVNQVVSTQNDPSGHGSGYSTQFGTDPSLHNSPDRTATLGDSQGNWADPDNQYRMYYGDQHRFKYDDGGFWHFSGEKWNYPDANPKTKTDAADVPPAG